MPAHAEGAFPELAPPRAGISPEPGVLARLYAGSGARRNWEAWGWGVALVAVCAWYAWRAGAFTWYTDVPLFLDNGRVARLPLSFSSIDHPIHIAREQAVIDALRQWRFPQWLMSPQGGYPVEFYPLGGAFIVAAVYALLLGAVPVAVVHKLVVIAVFMLPPLAYWLLARQARLPPGVRFLAGFLHLFTRGSWLGGGSRELIDFGLWPNVLASYLSLFVLLGGGAWVRSGSRRGLVLATGAATLAIYSNPRSILSLAAVWGVVALLAASELDGARALWRRIVSRLPVASTGRRAARATSVEANRPFLPFAGRVALLTPLPALLGAALLLPLRAHQNLYRFVRYVDFTRPGDVWQVYNEAVPRELIWLAMVGVAMALVRPRFFGRAVALLLPLSYALVLVAGWYLRSSPLFAQLEGPRLIPMLRPATIFLAALGAHELVRGAFRALRAPRFTTLAGIAAAGVAWFAFFGSASPIPAENRGLPWLQETTARPEFAGTARSAYRLADLSRPGDKPLVMGSSLSWHSAFWIGALTGQPPFYDDWAWFWRATDYEVQSALADEASALELSFLRRHGLTLVLIATQKPELLDWAGTKPYLQLVDAGTPGGYAIYRVAAPPGPENGWAALSDGTVTSVNVGANTVNARGEMARAGTAVIFVNAFPRWRARVNGQAVPIGSNVDGYISVPVPAGPVTIELYYITEPVGWLARGLVTLGVLLLGLVGLWPRLSRSAMARHAALTVAALHWIPRRSRGHERFSRQ